MSTLHYVCSFLARSKNMLWNVSGTNLQFPFVTIPVLCDHSITTTCWKNLMVSILWLVLCSALCDAVGRMFPTGKVYHWACYERNCSWPPFHVQSVAHGPQVPFLSLDSLGRYFSYKMVNNDKTVHSIPGYEIVGFHVDNRASTITHVDRGIHVVPVIAKIS